MTQFLLAVRLLVCLALALVMWEIAARVDDRVSMDAPLLEPYNPDILYTNDTLGMRGKPYARYSKWRFNSLGYRGPELDPQRIRVATLGASETFGLYESDGHEYPRQLERELNARAGGNVYQVMNVAYPGLSNNTALRRLPGMVATVRPSIVTIYPSLANYIDLPKNPNAISKAPEVSAYELRIAGKIRTTLKTVVPERVQTAVRRWEIQRAANGQVWNRLPEEHVRVFHRELLATIEALSSQGVKPVLVTHATRFGDRVAPEERPMLVAWRRYYPTLAEDGFIDMERRLNDVIRQVASEHKVLLVDAAHLMPSGPRYFADFVHFTDAGARQMAVLIAEHLQPALAPATSTEPPPRLR
jgi:hypothetical protein